MSETNGVAKDAKANNTYRTLQLDRAQAEAMKVLATGYVGRGRNAAVELAAELDVDKEIALREFFFHVKRNAEDNLK